MKIRNVPGFDDYFVSFCGSVFSTKTYRGNNWRMLNSWENSDGYLVVNLSKSGKQYKLYVHRLIAAAFLDLNLDSDMTVDHIDCDKTNNHASNLRIVTAEQNSRRKTGSVKGFYWNKQNKRWRAQIMINKKLKHLGYFANEADARQAYLDAAEHYNLTLLEN